MMISSEDNCIACFPVTNMSQMFLKLPFALLVGAFTVMMLKAHGQDQSDFISIDCGQLQTKEYTEPTTGITYGPETVDIVDTGVSKPIVVSDPRQQFQFVRMFPEGTRNCYKINIKRRQKYLIRASFLYGNYDGDKDLPEFSLHLGGDLWESVVISNASSEVVKELIHIPMRYYIHICLVNIDKGIPFISTIELRPLHKDTYQTESGTSLALHSRINMAANKARYRYPEDVNDRIWSSWMSETWKKINTSFNINTDKYQLPSLVLRTAATPKDDSIKRLSLMWQHSVNATYHFYWHFAEIIKFNSGLSRYLTININGKPSYRAIPQYLSSRTSTGSIAVGGGPFNFQIYSPPTSSYGPILNAYEIYTEKKLGSETDQQDVEALTNLKSTYGIIKNWQGDPCYPKEYIWAGVNCSYSDNDSARIISLNLSSSGLTEEIAASIFNLTMIQTLDLSNNKLSGQIPEYLSQLPKLNILNLEKNDLTGSVPAWLIAKENDGFSLSLCGNPSLSGQLPCGKQKKKKKNQFVIPVVVLIIIVSWVSFAAALVWKSKRFRAYWRLGKDSCTESENGQSSRGHDVFLSFRGDDIREGFARYLHDALDKNGIKTFFDDQNLQKGDEIGPTLVNAIEASEVSIILFSKNYVTSSWCLGELVHIIDCKNKNKDRRVVPVFYKVNPSDIRNQSGSFSLQTWIDRENVKVPVWKEALVEVANLSGYHYTRGYESETIEKIVENISGVLKQMKENSLRRFDTICPEGGEDEIVIYTTSSARDKNFQKCQTIIQSLSQFVLKVQQRDVTIRKFRKELKKLMKKDMPPPRVFVHGRYVGGYDEVSRLITNEPWFCETLDKIQKRDEVRLHGRDLVQQEDASSVSVSETDPGGRGGSPV